MLFHGILLAVFSGICNGLFSAPMKLAARWKWENIWMVFILVACWIMPVAMVLALTPGASAILGHAPSAALICAAVFGFLWGFGAICFGRSVDKLGVSMANSLVIGLSSALGSLVPLLMRGALHIGGKELVLFAGIVAFLAGVALCGRAGMLRDAGQQGAKPSLGGYMFAVFSGVMSAVFNIGYTLALPISSTGVALGYSSFAATNCIWLLMLGAGALPNLAYCASLMKKNGSARLFTSPGARGPLAWSVLMGLLWGASIFLYGAATPRLGELGPSVGWPLSLAVGLLVANLMGVWLGEWKNVVQRARGFMQAGIALLLCAIVLCALSSRMSL